MDTPQRSLDEAKAENSRDRMASLRKEMARRVVVDMSRIDWDLLRRQKGILVNLAASAEHTTRRDREAIQGIIDLIDHIQDETAITLGEKTVFGKSGR